MRPITSKDPRKRSIMNYIKEKTGATKVTCVGEDHNYFYGVPQKRVGDKRTGYYFEYIWPAVRDNAETERAFSKDRYYRFRKEEL